MNYSKQIVNCIKKIHRKKIKEQNKILNLEYKPKINMPDNNLNFALLSALNFATVLKFSIAKLQHAIVNYQTKFNLSNVQRGNLETIALDDVLAFQAARESRQIFPRVYHLPPPARLIFFNITTLRNKDPLPPLLN